MPESASLGGVPGSGGWGAVWSAPGGVSTLGGLLRGGIWSRGVSTLGGVWVSALEADTPLWTELQTPVKTLPWPNFVAAGNKYSNRPRRTSTRSDLCRRHPLSTRSVHSSRASSPTERPAKTSCPDSPGRSLQNTTQHKMCLYRGRKPGNTHS